MAQLRSPLCVSIDRPSWGLTEALPIDAESELIRAAPSLWHAANEDRSGRSDRQRSRFEYVTRWHYAGGNGREPREGLSQCEAALHCFDPFEERAHSLPLKHDEAGDGGAF